MAKTVGILGGMGPAATVDLFDRMVRATPAATDQDHLRILINNDTSIPDRTQAILHGGANPEPIMRAGIQLLAQMGAELVAIPCNTAHYYWEQLQAQSSIPVLNMIRESASTVRQVYPDRRRVGILATSGTLAVGLYQTALAHVDLEPLTPNPAQVATLMQAIYGPQGIKAGFLSGLPVALLKSVGQALIERGAQVLILGCTEIPLVLHEGDLPVPLIASNQVLAQAAVREALKTGDDSSLCRSYERTFSHE